MVKWKVLRSHILEELPKAGGSLDGENMPLKGYVVRGGRGNGEPL